MLPPPSIQISPWGFSRGWECFLRPGTARRGTNKGEKRERGQSEVLKFFTCVLFLLLIIPSLMRFWGIHTNIFPWRLTVLWPLFHHALPLPAVYSILNLGKSWNVPLHPCVNHDLIVKHPIELLCLCAHRMHPCLIWRNIMSLTTCWLWGETLLF